MAARNVRYVRYPTAAPPARPVAAPPTGGGRPPGPPTDLPVLAAAESVSTGDARAMSRVLFRRLAELEEGTYEYAYVRNTLVELNMALVRFAAARFRANPEPMEDIVQVGTIGLIKAIDRFEVERGLEFTTFAVPTISGEIKRFFRDTTWAVHVPRRLKDLRVELARATDAFAAEYDRAPTPAELADRLGQSVEEVTEALTAANGYHCSSTDAQSDPEDGEGALAARTGMVEHGFEAVENLQALKPLIAALPEREQRILSLRFGEELTQSQIGARLGLSQMHVSRLLSRTLAELREGLLAEE
ncbi:SigB/SigF/SigG family RNA polymerase sigma factor [Kitasatospora mediocidica]|uniref:SigB/SigF/SigG family RNA polymerase sigma factor n=1 Tax=Kitasatospora mediocidica TaxID=58352 RepID=UPI0007C78B92|nr:SigB/SigF/SigG family RNA polymerase sigma factor [Kitasatospora mediocidica]